MLLMPILSRLAPGEAAQVWARSTFTGSKHSFLLTNNHLLIDKIRNETGPDGFPKHEWIAGRWWLDNFAQNHLNSILIGRGVKINLKWPGGILSQATSFLSLPATGTLRYQTFALTCHWVFIGLDTDDLTIMRLCTWSRKMHQKKRNFYDNFFYLLSQKYI